MCRYDKLNKLVGARLPQRYCGLIQSRLTAFHQNQKKTNGGGAQTRLISSLHLTFNQPA